MLTYDDLAGFYCLGDLVGTAHLREADSPEDKDDEAGAGPAFVLRTGFVLLTGTVEVTDIYSGLTLDSKNKPWSFSLVNSVAATL